MFTRVYQLLQLLILIFRIISLHFTGIGNEYYGVEKTQEHLGGNEREVGELERENVLPLGEETNLREQTLNKNMIISESNYQQFNFFLF